MQRKNDFDSVSKCIQQGGQSIETLALDLIDWYSAERSYLDQLGRRPEHFDLPDNFFARDVLRVDSDSQETVLPNLRSLSLSAISFECAAREMQHALNVTGLSSLKLSNCLDSLELLNAIVVAAQPLQLRSFELVNDLESGSNQGDMDRTATISSFLTAFAGLEDLALLLPGPIDWARLSRAVSHHSATLKRTVTHESQESEERELVDSPIPWSIAMRGIYQNAKLDFIGTCHVSTDLVHASAPFILGESRAS